MLATAVAGSARRAYMSAGAILVLALVAVYVFPQLDKVANPTSTAPGLITYLGVGLTVLALTALMLFAGLRNVLPRTSLFLFAAFGYNAMMVIVKFALGPLGGLYTGLDYREGFWVLNGETAPFGFLAVAAITATLYGAAFFVIFLFHRSELRRRLGIPVHLESRFIVLLVVMFVLGVSGVVTVLGAFGFLEYIVGFFATLVIGVLVAGALIVAIVLCSVAFAEATEQAALVRNVAVLSTFAWIGLAFIAAYHVVWLVFVLTLVSIWPLKPYTLK